MAFVTDTPITERKSFGAVFSDWIFRIGHAVYVARGAEARMQKIDKLNAKSDAELAEMGLKREDIAAHVFRDILYI